MNRKKKIPFAYLGVFIAAFALAGACALWLPVPSEYDGLLFFGIAGGGSFLGVWLLALKRKKRR